MELIKVYHHYFIGLWKQKYFALAVIITGLLFYVINALFRDTMPNLLWIVWWSLSGSYFFALFSFSWNRYRKDQENYLEIRINSAPLYTYSVYNSDGAFLGNIDEVDYLRAR